MRHKRAGFKLRRDPAARKALLRGLVTSVIEQERVITTVPKAKAARPLVDKMITLAKRDTLHTRRQAAAFLQTPASVQKLFEKLGARFGQRVGGYTRIVRLGWRQGDGAEQAMLELVGSELVKRAAERAKRKEERMKAVREGRLEGRPDRRGGEEIVGIRGVSRESDAEGAACPAPPDDDQEVDRALADRPLPLLARREAPEVEERGTVRIGQLRAARYAIRKEGRGGRGSFREQADAVDDHPLQED